ncbi:type IV secretion system protein [Pantoea endophytica]|uniref:Type IV secretion system protein n=1 Tax=Pantoea sp. BJ2 TaxID=3141322 RepID=A0AAU7U3L2_9GAMM
MNKKIISVMIAVSVSFSGTAVALGIPTFDTALNTQTELQWVEKLQQWAQTVKHYQDQIKAYQNQLAAQTGLRDIQGLVSQGMNLKNDIADLAKQGLSINDMLTSNAPPTGALNSLYDKYKAFDVCNPQQSKSYETICKQETINKAWAVDQTSEVQGKISDALSDISSLSNRIANAKDTKESQDLANAVQAKSIQLNMLSSQWEMNMKASEQRDKLFAQKRKIAKQDAQIGAPVVDLN